MSPTSITLSRYRRVQVVFLVLLIVMFFGLFRLEQAQNSANRAREEAIRQGAIARQQIRDQASLSDRKLCLAFNHITWTDRQTIKFTKEKEMQARLLYAKLGFNKLQIESLIIVSKANAEQELERRKFVRCRKLPTQEP